MRTIFLDLHETDTKCCGSSVGFRLHRHSELPFCFSGIRCEHVNEVCSLGCCLTAFQHFVTLSRKGNIVISFDPSVLNENDEVDELSAVPDGADKGLKNFHGLCQRVRLLIIISNE